MVPAVSQRRLENLADDRVVLDEQDRGHLSDATDPDGLVGGAEGWPPTASRTPGSVGVSCQAKASVPVGPGDRGECRHHFAGHDAVVAGEFVDGREGCRDAFG